MIVKQITKESWKELSEDAHLISFGKIKSQENERIDFALICEKEDKPLGYLTAKEMDGKTLYWQFGGVFPNAAKSVLCLKGYSLFVEWCKPRYERVITYIENTNTAMLKMAMHVGFVICGVKYSQGNIFLQCTLEFKTDV